jgi:hypothetical protein
MPQLCHTSHHYRSAVLRLTWLALLLGASQAWSAEIEVRVQDKGSAAPLAGAAVCLGTPANPRQFGAYLNTGDGAVVFHEVPRSPLVLTVSRRGYRSYRASQQGEDFDRVIIVPLPRGGGGPVCTAPEQVRKAPPATTGLRVSSLRLNGGARSTSNRDVVLSFLVNGPATEYRVSETADLGSQSWRPLESQPTFRLSATAGLKTVYLQVRRHSEMAGASLQTLSNVAQAGIRLVGP